MKLGDVVLLWFSQTNLQRGKLRPALVVAVVPVNIQIYCWH